MMNQELSNVIDVSICKVCNGKLISDIYNNEKFCSSCGIVANYNHSFGTNERHEVSTDFEYVTSSGPASLTYDISLPSFIGAKNVDANGKQIQRYSEMDRLRRLNKYTISSNSKTRNLTTAIKEIQRITEILGFSNLVAERAAYIYRKALGQGLIKGRSIRGIVAATIHIACKEIGIPSSIERIEDLVENANKKNISYYYKFLIREMKINVGLPKPSSNISGIAKRAGLSGKTERKALEILSQTESDAILSGKKPVSLAAAALYLASIKTGEHATQLRIAIAAELTAITIRKRALELDEILINSEKIQSSFIERKLSNHLVVQPPLKLENPIQI